MLVLNTLLAISNARLALGGDGTATREKLQGVGRIKALAQGVARANYALSVAPLRVAGASSLLPSR